MPEKRYPRLFNYDDEGRQMFDQLSQQEQNEIWDYEHRRMLEQLVDEKEHPEKYIEREIAPGLFSKWISPGMHVTYVKKPIL